MKNNVKLSLANYKMLDHADVLENKSKYKKKSTKIIIQQLNKKQWTSGPYKKENWGNRLHSVAPYIGRIKPSFAHWLIKTCTKPGDVVFDPFCGIGTVPLEADLLGRKAIGFDLNDYAIIIAKAKFERRSLENNLKWLNKIELNGKDVTIKSIPKYVRQFYHPKTLREIIIVRDQMIKSHRNFLLGCLIGIVHGHRPQYLSAWTGYIIPFTPNSKPEYRPVLERMLAKTKRMYETGFPSKTNAIIAKKDARTKCLPNNSVDVVISSPPYFDTIDYVTSNRLRLSMLGMSDEKKINLKRKLIQKQKSYLEEMLKVGKILKDVLKNESLCIFVLGDVHKPNYSINTANEISKLYSDLGFKKLAIIEDEIPLARRTTNKWKGNKILGKTKRKLDRILVMELHK